MSSRPGTPDASVAPFYAGWDTYNQRMVETINAMSPEQLRLRPATSGWPLWATIGHTAGARVYWLCGVLGEAGADTTPFPDAARGVGWEDEDTPREAHELVLGLESTWRIVAACLRGWTVPMLQENFVRRTAGGTQVHTRQSVLLRLISHDAYHCGELSQILGIHGLPQIDLWQPQYEKPAGRQRRARCG